jgi:hypothetical protein
MAKEKYFVGGTESTTASKHTNAASCCKVPAFLSHPDPVRLSDSVPFGRRAAAPRLEGSRHAGRLWPCGGVSGDGRFASLRGPRLWHLDRSPVGRRCRTAPFGGCRTWAGSRTKTATLGCRCAWAAPEPQDPWWPCRASRIASMESCSFWPCTGGRSPPPPP